MNKVTTAETTQHPYIKSKSKNNELPVIGITLGDINGIGPEVVIKALSDKRIMKFFTPVIFGSAKVLSFYRKLMVTESFNYITINNLQSVAYGKVNVYNCWEKHMDILPGKVTPEGGYAAWQALKDGTTALKKGYLDAIVTAPINKHNIQSEDFTYPGHTEFFTETFEARDSLMLLVKDELRVGVVTGHIPLNEVSKQLTKEKIRRKINLLETSLKRDFGKIKPSIAVLGLNPHAGEEGLLGKEEQEIIIPVIEEFKKEGKLVFGPFPSDGFFGTATYSKFNGILAMYHDQGLIPFKTLAFDQGVNFTAGLPIVRTSPDHGTAYDIAGKNLAEESSMREALYVACDVLKNRQATEDDEK